MFYDLARRYDEWAGENYSGSSARGAMKGWNKHGVCSNKVYEKDSKNKKFGLTEIKSKDAKCRPLGAYFRVNHKDIVAMHSAIAEVGVLYATSVVHAGWNKVGIDGIITYSSDVIGGHAFAIVAYNCEGFWIQNSWGTSWGKGGFGFISYDDWLENGTDVWVARLGAHIQLKADQANLIKPNSYTGQSKAFTYADLRPHIISIGNDGKLMPGGNYGNTTDDLNHIFKDDFPRIMKDFKKKHLLLYAHGGLVSEEDAVNRLAGYKSSLLEAGIYPISFIWHSDYWSTITNVLRDSFRRRRPEGFIGDTKDFMLDRVDDTLEPIARMFTGKLSWDEMKKNAIAASDIDGAAFMAFEHILKLKEEFEDDLEIHVVGHSAGAIFHSAFINLIANKMQVSSCTLWAPACTVDVFKKDYLPSINNGKIKKFALFALSDKAEQDDNCAKIYNKSLLYLVSNAFESRPHIPIFRDGVPIVGMEKFINSDIELKLLFKKGNCELVIAPNHLAAGDPNASQSSAHGDFDDDINTVKATLVRILNSSSGSKKLMPLIAFTKMEFNTSKSSLRRRRMEIANQTEII